MSRNPNRKERRKAAKDAGFLGKKETIKEKLERTHRSLVAGKFIHLRNLTEQRNRNKNSENL